MKVCTLRPTKRFGPRYTKEELVKLLAKEEKTSVSGLKGLTIRELCSRLGMPILDQAQAEPNPTSPKPRGQRTRQQQAKTQSSRLKILTLCATPHTSYNLKIKDPYRRYLEETHPGADFDIDYVGLELKSKKLPRCRADITSQTWVSDCGIPLDHYDVIINEGCPIFIFKASTAETLRSLLKKEGVLLSPDFQKNAKVHGTFFNEALLSWEAFHLPVVFLTRSP